MDCLTGSKSSSDTGSGCSAAVHASPTRSHRNNGPADITARSSHRTRDPRVRTSLCGAKHTHTERMIRGLAERARAPLRLVMHSSNIVGGSSQSCVLPLAAVRFEVRSRGRPPAAHRRHDVLMLVERSSEAELAALPDASHMFALATRSAGMIIGRTIRIAHHISTIRAAQSAVLRQHLNSSATLRRRNSRRRRV